MATEGDYRMLVRRQTLQLLLASTAASALGGRAMSASVVDLGPQHWPAGEWDKYMRMQQDERPTAGSAKGKHGAVAVAYNALAARAGLQALEQGGNAIDALMTTAMTQIALTAGAPISYFGIMSLVYFDAKTSK